MSNVLRVGLYVTNNYRSVLFERSSRNRLTNLNRSLLLIGLNRRLSRP